LFLSINRLEQASAGLARGVSRTELCPNEADDHATDLADAKNGDIDLCNDRWWQAKKDSNG
jgi:hypothetical protein